MWKETFGPQPSKIFLRKFLIFFLEKIFWKIIYIFSKKSRFSHILGNGIVLLHIFHKFWKMKHSSPKINIFLEMELYTLDLKSFSILSKKVFLILQEELPTPEPKFLILLQKMLWEHFAKYTLGKYFHLFYKPN